MPLGSAIAPYLPFLRRYARALCGDQPSGDALVLALLESALSDALLRAQLKGGRIELYRALSRLWTLLSTSDTPSGALPASQQAAQLRLARITPRSRQALLLTAVEEFSREDTAEILGLTREDVDELVGNALADIAREAPISVMIIEDEPLIAMQLEDIVQSRGHHICACCATRDQAVEAAAIHRPALILADIQLADGSSGMDAVDDILGQMDVPVIFVTAFPERLLTGDRVEPTWLITKPFSEDAVATAIAQALFFRTATPAA